MINTTFCNVVSVLDEKPLSSMTLAFHIWRLHLTSSTIYRIHFFFFVIFVVVATFLIKSYCCCCWFFFFICFFLNINCILTHIHSSHSSHSSPFISMQNVNFNEFMCSDERGNEMKKKKMWIHFIILKKVAYVEHSTRKHFFFVHKTIRTCFHLYKCKENMRIKRKKSINFMQS